MILQRIAAGLVVAAGFGLLKLAIALRSWPLLGLGLAACTAGLVWFAVAHPTGAPVVASHGVSR